LLGVGIDVERTVNSGLLLAVEEGREPDPITNRESEMNAEATARKQALARLALFASPALYAVSFFLPVLDEPRRSITGFQVFVRALIFLLLGSLVSLESMNPGALVFYLVIFVPWSANIAYWVAVHRELIGQGRRAMGPGILAVLLGLSALVWPLGLSFSLFPHGVTLHVYRSGYWLWLGSMALHAFGSRALARARSEELALAQYWDD
jgi:hypothetical protein